MVTPDYVVIGHITRDVVPGGYVVGGTVTYAGLTAAALGRTVGVVTSPRPDIDLRVALPGSSYHLKPAAATTTFENQYHDGKRTQWIRAIADPLGHELIPNAWRWIPIAHLAPLDNELGVDILSALSKVDLIGVTPQGWISVGRRGDREQSPLGRGRSILPAVGAAILSEEDVGRNCDILRRLPAWCRY